MYFTDKPVHTDIMYYAKTYIQTHETETASNLY